MEQANPPARIGNNVIMKSQTGSRIISRQSIGNREMLTIPIRYECTVQTGSIRHTISISQPGFSIISNAMDGRTATDIIKSNAALRRRQADGNRMISDQQQQAAKRKGYAASSSDSQTPKQKQ